MPSRYTKWLIIVLCLAVVGLGIQVWSLQRQQEAMVEELETLYWTWTATAANPDSSSDLLERRRIAGVYVAGVLRALPSDARRTGLHSVLQSTLLVAGRDDVTEQDVRPLLAASYDTASLQRDVDSFGRALATEEAFDRICLEILEAYDADTLRFLFPLPQHQLTLDLLDEAYGSG